MSVVLLLLLAACGSSSKASSDGVSGNVNVFAAASLTAAFTEVGDVLEAANEGLTIENTFAGSQLLVTQIENGAPADVFASADEKNMQTLIDQDLVETPQVFAKNQLQIAVAPGNPKNIKTLADTQRGGINLVLADETVPAGNYARQAFEKAGAHIRDAVWTVGPYDLVLSCDAPSDEVISALGIQLGMLGNVRTTTMRAFEEKEMEQIFKKV